MKYDLPLTAWIRIGLAKDTLQRAVDCIHSGQPIIPPNLEDAGGSIEYINKILREEVLKQFNDSKRPLLEVILNGIDARPPDDFNYNIDVKSGWTNFSTKDNGKSMGLEKILTLLIIPFMTEKTGIEEIGRFGVGFLSTFKYCVDWPNKGHVIVKTNNGNERYSIRFYATGPDVRDLHMEITTMRLTKRKLGTIVAIRKKAENKKELINYLFLHLEDIPSYKAKIEINGADVNCSDNAKWYDVPVSLEAREQFIKQPLAIKVLEKKGIELTSQGVLVSKHPTDALGAVVSFPSAVLLVEGRNQFKKDANYDLCVKASFEALGEYIRDHELTPKFINQMLELIPDMAAAFGIRNLTAIPNIDALCEILLPGKKYVITANWYELVTGFVGKKAEELAFCASHKACSHWRAVYGAEAKLIKELVPIKETLSAHDYAIKVSNNPSVLGNSDILARILDGPFHEVFLAELPEHGPSCLMTANRGEKNVIWINTCHPYMTGSRDPTKVYAAVSDLYQNPGSGEILKVEPREVPNKIREHSNHFSNDWPMPVVRR